MPAVISCQTDDSRHPAAHHQFHIWKQPICAELLGLLHIYEYGNRVRLVQLPPKEGRLQLRSWQRSRAGPLLMPPYSAAYA